MVKKPKKKKDTELFFVEVKNPYEIRKYILNTLRDILELLQRFEKFKQVKHHRVEEIHKLGNLMRDTNRLMGKLKAKLPQANLKMIQKQVKKPEPAPQIKKELSDVEKLEAELKAIEQKLNSFN
jgi:DNA integrity scanning protein DisA with diadenylate cyclase activity